MFTQYISQNYLVKTSKLQFIYDLDVKQNWLKKTGYCFIITRPIINNNYCLISKQKSKTNNYLESLSKKKLMSRSFIVNLLNTYWQETVFLSKSNLLSSTYTDKPKSNSVTVFKKQDRKFLADFSKSLLMGRIKVIFTNKKKYRYENCLIDDSSVKAVKYIWRKGLNFSLPKLFSNFIVCNRRLNNRQVQLLSQLKYNNFPLFTVINNSNQMVVAEPSEQLISNKSLIDQLYQWYSNNILSLRENKQTYQALFFVNPKDALEYKNYIKYKYTLVGLKANLNLFTSGLDLYYKLVISRLVKIQFHIIPDLKELGRLVYKYQHKKNVSFHTKQKYSKNSFQGQPIYLIQPVLVKHRYTAKVQRINYNYQLKNNSSNQIYKTIFVNYRVALLAWQKFIQEHSDYKFPNKPQILVYNLEDFLKTYTDNENQGRNLLFIPGQESYKFLKLNMYLESPKGIIRRWIYLKTITKKIIWSLTSKQPVNL